MRSVFFFFSSRRRHTRWTGDWSSDVCSSDLDAYLSLDYQNQSGDIYRRVGRQIWRDRVEIEHEEPLELQLTSFIECANTGRQPRVSGSQATAALELAVKITKQIASSA